MSHKCNQKILIDCFSAIFPLAKTLLFVSEEINNTDRDVSSPVHRKSFNAASLFPPWQYRSSL